MFSQQILYHLGSPRPSPFPSPFSLSTSLPSTNPKDSHYFLASATLPPSGPNQVLLPDEGEMCAQGQGQQSPPSYFPSLVQGADEDVISHNCLLRHLLNFSYSFRSVSNAASPVKHSIPQWPQAFSLSWTCMCIVCTLCEVYCLVHSSQSVTIYGEKKNHLTL